MVVRKNDMHWYCASTDVSGFPAHFTNRRDADAWIHRHNGWFLAPSQVSIEYRRQCGENL